MIIKFRNKITGNFQTFKHLDGQSYIYSKNFNSFYRNGYHKSNRGKLTITFNQRDIDILLPNDDFKINWFLENQELILNYKGIEYSI